jgi:hypothetical protein
MIKMFIGTSSNGEDNPIEAIYEYSLRKNCSEEIDIVWMKQTNDPTSFWHGYDSSQWPTPFSGYRWVIPEYCNFEGRALYTDCDMINFRDIAELWNIDMEGKPLAARKGQRFGGHEFCVTLFDCEAYKKILDPMPASRQKNLDAFHHRSIGYITGKDHLVHELDPRWNCLDGEGLAIEDIWHLHWTKMATQPWRPGWFTGTLEEHPRPDLVELFEDMLIEANDAGYNGQVAEYPPIQYNIIGR